MLRAPCWTKEVPLNLWVPCLGWPFCLANHGPSAQIPFNLLDWQGSSADNLQTLVLQQEEVVETPGPVPASALADPSPSTAGAAADTAGPAAPTAPTVDPCPEVAAAELELRENASRATEDGEELRRQQLAMRAAEKDAKEEKKKNKEPSAKAKAKGRPRKNEDAPAKKVTKKRKSAKKRGAKTQEADDAEAPAATGEAAEAPAKKPRKKQRRTPAITEGAPAAEPAAASAPAVAAPAAGNPEMYPGWVKDFVQVLTEFKGQTYNKQEMTLHKQSLGFNFSFFDMSVSANIPRPAHIPSGNSVTGSQCRSTGLGRALASRFPQTMA